MAAEPLFQTTTYIGPQTDFAGDRGICQSYTLGDGSSIPPQLTGCSLSGQSLTIAGGAEHFDTLILAPYKISRTARTTNTTLTKQVYELDGVPAGNPPAATQAPPSLILALTGMAASGLYAVRGRLRRGVPRGSGSSERAG